MGHAEQFFHVLPSHILNGLPQVEQTWWFSQLIMTCDLGPYFLLQILKTDDHRPCDMDGAAGNFRGQAKPRSMGSS